MGEYITIIANSIGGLFDNLKDIILNKPLIPPLFPASGLGVSFIPVNAVLNIQDSNWVLDVISVATPYLRFLFLILTLVLTVISLILQWKKVRNKKK